MKRVFIIHGHDHAALYRVKDWLGKVGAQPIVLMDEPNSGLSVIEKFETHAKDCQFAVAMLTPDDKQATELVQGEKSRARQNVIFEMGWFMAKLGRKNVVLLHKGQVELPSDVLGILYLPFRDSVNEAFDSLRRELQDRGII